MIVDCTKGDHMWATDKCLACGCTTAQFSIDQQARMLRALDSIDATMKALLGAMTEAVDDEDPDDAKFDLDGNPMPKPRDQKREL